MSDDPFGYAPTLTAVRLASSSSPDRLPASAMRLWLRLCARMLEVLGRCMWCETTGGEVGGDAWLTAGWSIVVASPCVRLDDCRSQVLPRPGCAGAGDSLSHESYRSQPRGQQIGVCETGQRAGVSYRWPTGKVGYEHRASCRPGCQAGTLRSARSHPRVAGCESRQRQFCEVRSRKRWSRLGGCQKRRSQDESFHSSKRDWEVQDQQVQVQVQVRSVQVQASRDSGVCARRTTAADT